MVRIFLTVEVKGKKYSKGVLINNLSSKGKYISDRRVEIIRDFMKIGIRNSLALIYQEIDGLDKNKSQLQARKIQHELIQ